MYPVVTGILDKGGLAVSMKARLEEKRRKRIMSTVMLGFMGTLVNDVYAEI